MTELSRDTEKNKPRTEEMISLFEAKGVEQEETQVYKTLVSSRLAEVHDRAVENEITIEGTGYNVHDADKAERSSRRDADEFAKGVPQNAN